MRTLKLLAAVGVVLLIFAGCLFFPCMDGSRPDDTGPRFMSGLNLKQIAFAMQSYQDIHKHLPPAVVRDRHGKPLYSWRVAILPFLEQDALFRRFKLDEPWDSQHNKKLIESRPTLYAISWPETPPGLTPYQVYTGPGTAFERDGFTLRDDFPDGPSNTILVVESAVPVPWTKPTDLVYDPKGPLPPVGAGLGLPVRLLCVPVGERPGFTAAFVDGHTRFLLAPVDEQTMRAFITRNGGEQIDPKMAD